MFKMSMLEYYDEQNALSIKLERLCSRELTTYHHLLRRSQVFINEHIVSRFTRIGTN